MEKVKNLCDNYERKLDDTEKKLGESRKDLEAAQVKLHAEQERATLWEGRAKEARSEATYMRSQVMLLNRRALESQAEAKELAEESAQATKARAMVEEKNRRLEEILKETRKIEDLVSKENKGLVAKLARLQKWTECMDDDEVRRTMRQLYQELENWIKRHLLGSLPKHDGDEPSMSYKVQTLHETQTDVYGLIFHSILRQFFVAIYDEQFESLFRKLDQEVLAHCPEHTWHHWRSATSNALFSYLSPDLHANCDSVLQIIETRFATRSETDAELRTEELRRLLWKFVEFKNQLERQKDRYAFWWFVPGMPFNEENMSSLSGENSPDGIVQFSLSPMVFKSRPLQDKHTIVQRAEVKLMPRTALAKQPATTDGDLHEEG